MMSGRMTIAQGPMTNRKRKAKLQTTLYDLIQCIQEEVGSDEERFVVPAVIHVLQRYRVTAPKALRGLRGQNASRPGRLSA